MTAYFSKIVTDMCKLKAIQQYTCDASSAEDYGKFMESPEHGLTIWEPFEYEEWDRLKELIENEFLAMQRFLVDFTSKTTW